MSGTSADVTRARHAALHRAFSDLEAHASEKLAEELRGRYGPKPAEPAPALATEPEADPLESLDETDIASLLG